MAILPVLEWSVEIKSVGTRPLCPTRGITCCVLPQAGVVRAGPHGLLCWLHHRRFLRRHHRGPVSPETHILPYKNESVSWQCKCKKRNNSRFLTAMMVKYVPVSSGYQGLQNKRTPALTGNKSCSQSPVQKNRSCSGAALTRQAPHQQAPHQPGLSPSVRSPGETEQCSWYPDHTRPGSGRHTAVRFKIQELYLWRTHTGYAVKWKVAMLSGMCKRIPA